MLVIEGIPESVIQSFVLMPRHTAPVSGFTSVHFQTDAGCKRVENNKLFKYNTGWKTLLQDSSDTENINGIGIQRQ